MASYYISMRVARLKKDTQYQMRVSISIRTGQPALNAVEFHIPLLRMDISSMRDGKIMEGGGLANITCSHVESEERGINLMTVYFDSEDNDHPNTSYLQST